MNKFTFLATLSLLVSVFASTVAFADATPGSVAPAFETADIHGKSVKLADYAGKWVVLEWFNKDCPFVKKHYGSGNMQKLQKTYTGKGVVWLSILSSAKGKEGYTDAAASLKVFKDKKSAASDFLLDPSGTVGRAYGAKTTPHIFVINPEGNVVYAGAIDDNDSSDPAVIASSKNYVSAALDASLAGKAIETASTRPYGCGVKY
jgi:peroxiredoxin